MADIETPADAGTPPAAPAPGAARPRFGGGVLAAAIAASLMGGLALGGAGGFALATFTRAPAHPPQAGMQGPEGPERFGHRPAQGGRDPSLSPPHAKRP